jgi:uncharacterized protein YdeI (YjbR/CyaY-like superfamily)
MAKAIWLVTKADVKSPDKNVVNGITAVVIQADSAQTSAQVRAAAVTRLQAAGHPVRANYFDAAVDLSTDQTTGPMKDNNDLYYLGDCVPTKFEG